MLFATLKMITKYLQEIKCIKLQKYAGRTIIFVSKNNSDISNNINNKNNNNYNYNNNNNKYNNHKNNNNTHNNINNSTNVITNNNTNNNANTFTTCNFPQRPRITSIRGQLGKSPHKVL